MPFSPQKIRPLAVALLCRPSDGKYLAIKGWDKAKQQYFYRLSGGGIKFGELATATLQREFMEEFGIQVAVGQRIDVVENLFLYNGRAGHELIFVYQAQFMEKALYELENIPLIEEGIEAEFAEWIGDNPAYPVFPVLAQNLIEGEK